MILPSFSAACRCRAVGSPTSASLWVSLFSTAPPPAGSLDRWGIFTSFLESHWPCCHPQPGLHDFSCSSEHDFDVEVANSFLLCLQGEFQTYLWDIVTRIFKLSVPAQVPIHSLLLFLLFPSSKWLLLSISNKISDDSSDKDHKRCLLFALFMGVHCPNCELTVL